MKSENTDAEDYDAYLELYSYFGQYDEELHGEPIHPLDEVRL